MPRFPVLPTVTAFFSIWLIFVSYLSFTRLHQGEGHCDGVRMIPGYAWLQNFNSENSRMGSKYKIYYYREGEVDTSLVPTGTPVLFIPGNAGSYAQARSIASYCSKRSAAIAGFTQEEDELLGGRLEKAPGGRLYGSNGQHVLNGIDRRLQATQFDFFTADFSEDLTAFHGKTLLDQAEYVNDAIGYILSMYDDTPENPAPSSIIVIGHSMGGIVARTLVALPNYRTDSINTIITLSTPHVLPPLAFDRDITAIYDKVNQYWRHAFDPHRSSENPLENVSLISLTGGQSDAMVPSDYTDVSSLVPISNGFSTFTYSVPNVWTGIDHLAIVWCAQLRHKLGNVLFHISDPFTPQKTVPLKERMRVFKLGFLSGLEDIEVQPRREKFPTIELAFSDMESMSNKMGGLNIPHLGGDSPPVSMYLFKEDEGIQIYTNATLYPGPDEEGLQVLLCDLLGQKKHHNGDIHETLDVVSGDERKIKILCSNVHPKIVKLPQSTVDSQHPFDNSGRNTISMLSYEKSDLEGWTVLALVDTYKSRTDRFVSTSAYKGPAAFNGTLASLLFGSRVVILEGSGYNNLSVPDLKSNLFSLNVRLEPGPVCRFATRYFTPVIRQSIQSPLESKFFVNTGDKNLIVSHHGNSPFLPYKEKDDNSLRLEIFAPPLECRLFKTSTYQVRISINWIASLGNFFLRYRTILAIMPLAITCLAVLTQLREYNITGIYITFSQAILVMFRWQLSGILLGLSLLQVFLSHPGTVAKLISLLRYPSMNSNLEALKAYSAKWTQNTLYLGISSSHFWFVGPIFFIVCLGLVITVHSVVQVTIANISRFAGFPMKQRLQQSIHEKNPVTTEDIYARAFPVILSVVLLYHIPYQVAFIFTVVFTLFIAQQSYHLQTIPSSSEKSNVNFYNFTMSILMLFVWTCAVNAPMVAVWFKNLSLKWSLVFSTYDNVLSILPIIFLVVNISNGHMIPRLDSKIQQMVTTLILGYTAVYAVLFGFLQTYMLHYLINLFCGWLLIVYMKDIQNPRLKQYLGQFVH